MSEQRLTESNSSTRARTLRKGFRRTKRFARELRKNQTPAEAQLWALIRARRFGGLKFRRQSVIGGYIVDFYCPAARLAVELDGRPHIAGAVRDAERDAFLAQMGISVLRFWNHELVKDQAVVLDKIQAEAERLISLRNEARLV